MALGVGTTTADSSLGPGYTPQGSWGAAVAPITASITVGITVNQAPYNTPVVQPSKVGG